MLDTNTKINALLFGDPRIKITNKIPDVEKAFDEFEEVIADNWSDILANEDERKKIKIFIANACTFIVDHLDKLEFREVDANA